MRIYVAASSREADRVRAAQRMLREAGHTLTLDWLTIIERVVATGVRECDLPDHEAIAHALLDLDAIRDADAVWLLAPELPTKGAWVELGFAVGIGKPIVISGPQCRQSIFCRFGLLAGSDAEGLAMLGRLG